MIVILISIFLYMNEFCINIKHNYIKLYNIFKYLWNIIFDNPTYNMLLNFHKSQFDLMIESH